MTLNITIRSRLKRPWSMRGCSSTPFPDRRWGGASEGRMDEDSGPDCKHMIIKETRIPPDIESACAIGHTEEQVA